MKRLALVAGLAGCFPHHPIARNIALGVEGATAVAGLGIAAFVKPSTSCTSGSSDGDGDFGDIFGGPWCNTTDASIIGAPMIIAGLAAMVITMMTSPLDATPPKPVPALTAVGRLGDSPALGMAAALAKALGFARSRSLPLEQRILLHASFDQVERMWVFEWAEATITVAESGHVEIRAPESAPQGSP